MRTFYMILLCLFAFSCKKKYDFRTVRGQILDIKDSTPIAKVDYALSVLAESGRFLHKTEKEYYVGFTTDDNGFFSATWDANYGGTKPALYRGAALQANFITYLDLPSSEPSDVGKIYTGMH